MKNFLERLGKEWLFYDGGMGSLLQEKGLQGGELPETWNLTHPEEVLDAHCGYLEAGCDVICANTFGANALKYPGHMEEVVGAAVSLAKEARTRSHREDAYIALDIGPTGKLLQPFGDLPFDAAVSLFAGTIRAGAAAGADLIQIETMSDIMEAKAAVLAARENSHLPVCITLVFDTNGRLLTGGTVESAVAMLEGLHVDALGMNCGLGPEQMLPLAERLLKAASVPVIITPNAGLPRFRDGKTVYEIGPDAFAQTMCAIAALGVQAVGGCCGTTPAHLRRTIEAVRDIPFRPAVQKHRTVVSSSSAALEIGSRPVLIGERINPTGKKRFQQALREKDMDYILTEALHQESAGADMLDVNVGLPDIDEPAVMAEVVTALQGVTDLPLQLDSSDRNALERGLRLCRGKAMINSVNGKQESMEAVFPLVRKYGGVVVALCLDENGIPGTADGRIAIARKILKAAEEYGIPQEDIVIDGLAMTVSSDSRSALTTLETVRRVRDELHGHSILGVSNISFGLPQRPLINAAFLTMALTEGLSCAIINPENEQMMAAWRSFMALTDRDPHCSAFIGAYGNTGTVPAAPAAALSSAAVPAAAASSSSAAGLPLGKAVERGVAKRAAEAAQESLQAGAAPLDLINSELIPALDRVGSGYEKGTIYLPQLLMSAEAAKAAFNALKEAMKETPREKKGRLILATVHGDVHDIGKNIVKVLLENYGYDVIDLGKDVPPETVVKTALQEKIPLVGLSALMTTTVCSMEETIRQLRSDAPAVKVVVGGAVMTQEYADRIGADCYAHDAMATVRYADRLFEREE
jgi:5-methyltetrahydrofolate--homocysteine methyltransferase